MSKGIKVLNTKKIGNGKCKSEEEHKWVYNPNGKLTMIFPPKFINDRICEVCGRHEEVQKRNLTKGDENKFNKCVEKFSKEV